MDDLTVIIPGEISPRLKNITEYALKGYNFEIIRSAEHMGYLRCRHILFCIELGNTGINVELYRMLEKIKLSGNDYLRDCVGSLIVNGSNELYTRSVARQVILYANMAGCMFIGRPLIEATGSLMNFITYKKLCDMDYIDICMNEAAKVVERLVEFKTIRFANPRILTLHASNYKTSNTLTLWNMVKSNLADIKTTEIHIENGSIKDCRGCKYKACKHFAESANCFYGGAMVEEIYPAIINCDILILLCPNYNDAISANISAVINRLTALFRKVKFYDKYVYSIIVSGHSGSDVLAEQIISALNINKTFMLPSKFALMETANDPGEIMGNANISDVAKAFAKNIRDTVLLGKAEN